MFDWLRRLLFGRFYKADDFAAQATEAQKQYDKYHQPSVLEKTIEHYRSALDASGEQHDRYCSILINLAVALTDLGDIGRGDPKTRYSEPIDLLSTARKFMETKSAQERPKNYSIALISLGRLYLNRYREEEADADLQASIEAYKQVRSASPPGSFEYCISLTENAAAIWTSCELQPRADDAPRLDEALKFLNEAHEGKHPQLEGECFKHLAAVHDLLYREISTTNLKKAMVHLKSAIEFNQSSVRLLRVRTADPALSPTLLNLARQQFSKYTAISEKDEADLRYAEMNCQEAKALALEKHGSTELLDKIDRLASDIQQYKKTAVLRRGSADRYKR